MERIPASDVRSEEEVREEQHRLLETLSGFSRLSEDQRRYIKATLYIQQRAERESDPITASRIQTMPDKFQASAPGRPYISHSDVSTNASGLPEAGRYFQSQVYIMNEYCHGAVKKLENYGSSKDSTSSWLEAGPITNFLELAELIELARADHEFPFVIEARYRPLGEDRSTLEHSTVLLGQDENGEFTVWEKSGYHTPFQITSLKQVYEAYKQSTGWRVRPLSV